MARAGFAMKPEDLLREILTTINSHGSAELASYTRRAFAEFATGRAATLCAALGLRSVGRGNLRAHLAAARRDRWIMGAWTAFPGESIADFAVAIARFQSVTWPRVRDHATPPDRLTMWQVALWHAAHVSEGAPLPTSHRQVRRLITEPRDPNDALLTSALGLDD
jgi:hypothetical protein